MNLIKEVLRTIPKGLGITALREIIKGSSNELKEALDQMIQQGVVERISDGKSKPYVLVPQVPGSLTD